MKIKVKGRVRHGDEDDPLFLASYAYISDLAKGFKIQGFSLTAAAIGQRVQPLMDSGFGYSAKALDTHVMDAVIESEFGVTFGGLFSYEAQRVYWEWFISNTGDWYAFKNGVKVK